MRMRKTYTAEFKREAVKLTQQADVSVPQIAKELGISEHSLYKWRRLAREQGDLALPGNGRVTLSDEQRENQRLRGELERVKQERDILKKAVSFFARESR
jgi:transposase